MNVTGTEQQQINTTVARITRHSVSDLVAAPSLQQGQGGVKGAVTNREEREPSILDAFGEEGGGGGGRGRGVLVEKKKTFGCPPLPTDGEAPG